MAFIIIETKTEVSAYRYVILDILTKTYQVTKVEDSLTKLIIYHEPKRLEESDLFLNLAEELYTDLRVYVSDDEPKFEPAIIMEWLDLLKFHQTAIYDDYTLLLKRTEYPLDTQFKKLILKSVYNDQDLLYTVKVFLETNQNMSRAAQKLYLHRNTLIQRLDKFYNRTRFDCRKFVDAYIIYSLLK